MQYTDELRCARSTLIMGDADETGIRPLSTRSNPKIRVWAPLFGLIWT